MSVLGYNAPIPRRRAPRSLHALLRSRRATIGLAIIAFFVFVALFGRILFPHDPTATNFTSLPEQPPSGAHWLGTDQQTHDIFQQMVWGTRPTLLLGFSIGVIATTISVLVGVTSGYLGGLADDVLGVITNVFLVIPTIPLMIVLGAWLHARSDTAIIAVISLTSWAFGARVLRSQTLSLRQRDFVQLAIVRGESSLRIVLTEILPNMVSLVVSGLIGTTVFAIGTAAGLEFIGIGNLGEVSWFSILYWAQNTSSIQTGAWWTFVPPGVAIALLGMGLTLVNYGIDEISNPRLRTPRRRLRLTPPIVVPSVVALRDPDPV